MHETYLSPSLIFIPYATGDRYSGVPAKAAPLRRREFGDALENRLHAEIQRWIRNSTQSQAENDQTQSQRGVGQHRRDSRPVR